MFMVSACVYTRTESVSGSPVCCMHCCENMITKKLITFRDANQYICKFKVALYTYYIVNDMYSALAQLKKPKLMYNNIIIMCS